MFFRLIFNLIYQEEHVCRGHGECWTFVGGMGNAGHIFVGGKGNAGHSATHELIIHHALYVKSLR